jgi:acyl-CoA synthetase (AMP-forming)/AMP-acid ligase II
MNIGSELTRVAGEMPQALAVVEPAISVRDRYRGTRIKYRSITFQELDEDSSRIAVGLHNFGVQPGMRLALLVKPGIDFVSLVFALFKAGVVTILIDPGIGRDNLVRCLAEAQPRGFVALPIVQFVRLLKRKEFPLAKFNVTVGRRWCWGGMTLQHLRQTPVATCKVTTEADDPAAIIFTSGSTGPPKGVLYRHGNFAHQVTHIQQRYDIRPGEIDLPGFPLFGLFNSVMGVTTVFPDMDFTRPADVRPELFLQHARDWQPTQSFGSPALWNTVSKHCQQKQEDLGTIRRVLSAGAPVPVHVLHRVQAALGKGGEMHTPYGATEALPVASISASEVLGETAARSAQGAGTCVGTRFSGIEWRVVAITDDPIPTIADSEEVERGKIGELIVKGPVVTTEYVTGVEANALAKIRDGEGFWHRMGDCGYLDDQERFWYCGRKSHRVLTETGTMFTIPCEAIANEHPHVYRSALVGIGESRHTTPVMLLETWPEHRPESHDAERQLLEEVHRLLQRNDLTRSIAREHLLWHSGFPVDIRHNAKIFREQLVVWAAERCVA